MDNERKKNRGIMPPLSGSFDEVTKKIATSMSSNKKAIQMELIPEGELQICRFSNMEVRKQLHNNEWYFSIIDVVRAMTNSSNPRRYWTDLKAKIAKDEGAAQLYGEIVQLKMKASDDRERDTDCANTETIFRIVQSIPSPNAEPFKRWLAKVGYERIQEHQNPDIAVKRAIATYTLQGKDAKWIENRLKSLTHRRGLTDEWKSRGIVEGVHYAILTNTVHQGTFGKSVKEHKAHKGLAKQSIREHMTDMELSLISLAEVATKEIAQTRDAQGFIENKEAATAGGNIAGNARKQLEEELGRSVVSNQNFIPKKDDTMKLRKVNKLSTRKRKEE